MKDIDIIGRPTVASLGAARVNRTVLQGKFRPITVLRMETTWYTAALNYTVLRLPVYTWCVTGRLAVPTLAINIFSFDFGPAQ